ncbi:hypothetical protein [Sorangium cellulosum]|uniref:hypothetical protein n=1 Tax=Sorangium cellulosum TaxID=56 RepID=UPI0011DE2924|nr:hypothetical protein [Sorangium cellulosum]
MHTVHGARHRLETSEQAADDASRREVRGAESAQEYSSLGVLSLWVIRQLVASTLPSSVVGARRDEAAEAA